MTSLKRYPLAFKALLLSGLLQTCVAQAAVGAVDPAKAAATSATVPAPPSRAAPGRTGLDDRIRTTADDGAVVKGGKRSGSGRYLMRCWQYGRLVFEEARDTLLVESSKVMTVGRSQEPGETIQVLDMASSSCVLSSAP